ncbi:hypothetical protein PR202_gb11437 [Eleusine coracana subsp. coracana]|uniref:Uncharacterized protein n=1 Tax=Eleusine coracana subsp. coracana TaxID=191504 RepID=A0AAV5EK85_ELECO|nr:hypothetical protein PR202_gb11437 [Eleusine coracana subsp. coracana]
MAATRRLSELLQEQQEPFLIEAAYRTRRPRRGFRGVTGGCCPSAATGGAAAAAAACRRLLTLCNSGFIKKRRTSTTAIGGGVAGLRSALSKVLCGRAMRRVLRWEDLAAGGCFSGAGGCGGREFRRLRRYSGECDPRAMEFGWKDDGDVDSSRQLSPVSVLDLRSDHDGDDDSSPVYSHWDDEKPSTSGSSPPSDAFLGPASPCFSYNLTDKFCEMDVDESADDETVSRNNGGKSLEEQISSWEKIAGDISRIPSMMELDVQQSVPQWREHRPEVARSAPG